jgi:nitrogen fixation/metabolism regulation signal transduction histidine kinase
MTRRLAFSRDEARQNRDEVEAQRAYLEAVLANLSSGVMTLDTRRRLRTANVSAKNILGLQADAPRIGEALSEICRARPFLEPFRHAVEPHLQRGAEGDWQEQVILSTGGGRRTLICRGTSLGGAAPGQAGHVIVFDDITALIQGQRDAAWSEVARRLAHEIKNPLTPIQLSAERLRLKYLKSLPEKDAEMLDRLTHTIVQQVETMKEMVNTFSDYARAPQMRLQSVSINQLVQEVLDLYRNVAVAPVISLQLSEELPNIQADPSRLRQVLNNLIKNALEASENGTPAQISVSTHRVSDKKSESLELRIADQGRGIPADQIDRVFEPYITHKTKGTGLGLAIAKKIVEEHGGTIWLENNATGGASSVIRLPLVTRSRENSNPLAPLEALRA